MKKFKLKKLTGVKGRRVVMDDGDEPLGEVSFDELDLDDAELDELLAGRAGGKTMNELLAERVGVRGAHGDAPTLEQIREDLALGEAARSEKAADDRRKLLLGEGLRDGVILSDKVKQFAREGRITLEEYMTAEETHKKLDEATRCGKVLPRDRQFFFEVGLRDPAGFDRWLRGAPKVIDLVTRGLASTTAPAGVEDEVMARTREYMAEHKMNDEQYGEAMRKVLATDRELDRRFRAVAQERVVAPPDVGQ